MRTSTFAKSLGLALALSTAGVAGAQSTGAGAPPAAEGREHGMRGMRGEGRGGPGGMLLKGITLTADQKTRLEALRKDQGDAAKGSREQFRTVMDEARAARERGDTATANAKMAQVRASMQAQRDRQIASIRPILTSAQQKQLDANVAEMKKRDADRGNGQGWGRRGGRGEKGRPAGSR